MPGPVTGVSRSIAPAETPEGQTRAQADFGSIFKQAIERVEGLRRTADESVLKLLAGENEEVHQVALAVQRAELAFELFLEIRNKVVQAYQEIMRMPI
ncbi:MAG: flagellar hook-basal body complex protein FliE [Bryobacteraceae bacterium]